MEERLCVYLRGDTTTGPVSEDALAAAREHGVFLLLADRLRLTAFAAELRQAAIVDALRTRELQAVLAALTGAGVHAVLFKGAAVAHTHYPRPELRPRSDTDLLIPIEARDRVFSALSRLGYRQPAEIDSILAVGQFHFVKTDEVGLEHALDVHWRLSNVRAFADVLSYEELAGDAVPVSALGPHARSASPVHALLVACVHRVAHHADTTYLLWLYDVQLLSRSLTAVDREAFVALASAKRVQAVCERTLTLAQDAFGGLDVGWIDSLAPGAVEEPTSQFVGGGLRQVDILASDFGATAWGSKMQLLRAHLFPPPSYMRERYPGWPALLLPLAYARRIVAGAPRWLRR
nr:hypothetical protein Hi04_10k_c3996_00012 [uncultured bacterium]